MLAGSPLDYNDNTRLKLGEGEEQREREGVGRTILAVNMQVCCIRENSVCGRGRADPAEC